MFTKSQKKEWTRNAIYIVPDPLRGRLYCTFSGTNLIDYTHNTFNLLMFDESKQRS